MKELKQKAYEITMGVITAIGVIFFFTLVLLVVRNTLSIGIDDSDFSGWKRSGLRLHIDAKTGLQYFSSKNGIIIPRLNKDGTHMVIEN